ncbi:MAG TPA: tetratricopeptide repeat protein, partial [Candidatus Obscuribacterales bacterium]
MQALTKRLDEQLRKHPSAQLYLQRAQVLHRQGKTGDAISDATQCLKTSPRNVSAYLLRGDLNFAIGESESAQKDYQQAISIRPSFHAYYQLGQCAMRQNDPSSAIKMLSEAINLDPKNVAACMLRGNAHVSRRDFARAAEDFSRAIAMSPNLREAYFLRGDAKRRMRNWRAAIPDYTRAIEIDARKEEQKHDIGSSAEQWTSTAMAFQGRAICYAGMQQYELAAKDYTKAIELDKDSGLAYKGRGWIRFWQNDYPRAESDLERSLSLEPSPDGCYRLAIVKMCQGKYKQAMRNANGAVTLDPSCVIA